MLGHADMSVPYYGITDAFGLLPHLSVLPLAFLWVHGELFGELTWLRKRLLPFIWVGCQVNPSSSLVCKHTAAVPAEERGAVLRGMGSLAQGKAPRPSC